MLLALGQRVSTSMSKACGGIFTISPELATRYLGHEPVDKAWYENETTYLQVRNPARPQPPFFTAYKNLMEGQEFDPKANVTLWPHIKMTYAGTEQRWSQ